MEQTKSKKREKREGMNQMKVCLEKRNIFIYILNNIEMQLKFMRVGGM
jgi:hypothetical protein